MKEISAEEILELSWRSYKEHWKILTIASVLIVVFHGATLLALLGAINGSGMSGGVLLPILLIATVIIEIGFIKIFLNITGNKPVKLRQLFGNHNFSVRYVIGASGFVILATVGLCLLIVPGVIYMIRYSLWPFFLVNKDLDLVESFQESKRITQGSKKDLFFVYLALLGSNVVGVLLLGIGFLVSLPFSYLIVAHVYRKLQLLKTNESLQEKKSHWHVNY